MFCAGETNSLSLLRKNDEKIQALERQLQVHPNKQMEKKKWLKELQFKFNRMRQQGKLQMRDEKAEQKKWQDAYKQVNDNKNPVDVPPSPFEQALMNGSLQIEKEGFDGDEK